MRSRAGLQDPGPGRFLHRNPLPSNTERDCHGIVQQRSWSWLPPLGSTLLPPFK
ncbi:hypothetical protein M885DRAFT_540125 [Pelagophyceae sp. CCMP2097]|nr:hypothetical protein M885DRAFT_540125 [Pelagophyceae sp. CCMP2097]